MMEYVRMNLFFDICGNCGALGEGGGRFFIEQMCDIVSYLHLTKNTVHLDLKAPNILVDKRM